MTTPPRVYEQTAKNQFIVHMKAVASKLSIGQVENNNIVLD